MEISVLQSSLHKALTTVKPFAGQSSYLPICETVKLSTENGNLRLDVTDLEKTCTVRIPAMIHQDGEVCANAKFFTSFIGTLKGERVDIKVTGQDDDPNMYITSGEHVDAAMACVKASEFPPLPYLAKSTFSVEFDPDSLLVGFNRLGLVMAQEESRPVLYGTNLELGPDGYTMVAADGFRLGVQTGQLSTPPDGDHSFILPRGTVLQVAKLLKSAEGQVGLDVGATCNGSVVVLFRVQTPVGDCEVFTQVVSGKFPNYDSLVPQAHDWKVKVKAESFKVAAESAGVYADAGSEVMRFWMDAPASDDGVAVAPVLQVSAETEEVGNAKRETACIEGEGLDGKPKIAFKASYVRDICKIMDGDVEFSGTTHSSPGVFAMPDDNFKLVVMPMFVQW